MCPLFRAQIYDDSTAADSTQRTDGGTDGGSKLGQFLISFCVVLHVKMTTLKHKTFPVRA